MTQTFPEINSFNYLPLVHWGMLAHYDRRGKGPRSYLARGIMDKRYPIKIAIKIAGSCWFS